MAHSLQLPAGDAEDSTRGSQELRKKAKAIVGHYKHGNQAPDRLDDFQKRSGDIPIHVRQDIEIRWNSK